MYVDKTDHYLTYVSLLLNVSTHMYNDAFFCGLYNRSKPMMLSLIGTHLKNFTQAPVHQSLLS